MTQKKEKAFISKFSKKEIQELASLPNKEIERRTRYSAQTVKAAAKQLGVFQPKPKGRPRLYIITKQKIEVKND